MLETMVVRTIFAHHTIFQNNIKIWNIFETTQYAASMSQLQKRLQMSFIPPKPPSLNSRTGVKKGMGGGRRDYTPATWDKYFESKQDINISRNSFRVYESGSDGPVCFFLHGGGFSGLSWAVLSKILVYEVKCRCVAVDLRGHGDTYTDNDEDMSADTLANDVAEVISTLYINDPPPVFLIGHSMGGAVAVRVAAKQLVTSLIGLAVIDVVEGTALNALTSMQALLRGRPKHFSSLEEAIEWSIRSGHIRNLESAKVSMVGQMKKESNNLTGTEAISRQTPEINTSGTSLTETPIVEEDEESAAQGATQETTQCATREATQSATQEATQSATQEATQSATHGATHGATQQSQSYTPAASTKSTVSKADSGGGGYTWRIDLTKTEAYWRGWFEGLSELFLSCTIPKMLLLAGVDRLDKDLTIGQMQGKFQMQVLPQCGHAVHEDSPDKVADVIANFLVRHKMAEATSNFERTFPSC